MAGKQQQAEVDVETAVEELPTQEVKDDTAARPAPVKSMRTMTLRKNAPPPGNPHLHEATVEVAGLEPSSVAVKLDVEGQHTLHWSLPLTLKAHPGNPLPAGSCNFYIFPAFKDESGESHVAEGQQLDALKALMVAVGLSELANEPDQVGAYPIHAITVANTEEAINMSEMMYTANPRLLLQVHAMHRAGFPLFTGESSLHICAVNQREDLFIKLIELMMTRLSKEEANTLLRSQAVGVFFDDMPMREYGGNPLAYALCFDLRRAARAMLDTGLVSLNDRTYSCEITGFMPLHAVTANGLTDTYDWLTTELPEGLRADLAQRTGVGRQKLNSHDLLAVQLAAKLGDQRTVKHILQKQTSILWIWGPVTQHSINLAGIDSAGEGGGDIMELVARLDAKRETTELVLDSFMTGFIYQLFQLKWKKYGAKLYYSRMIADSFMLLMLLALALVLKQDPGLGPSLRPMCVAMLVLMAFLSFLEVHVTFLYYRNNQGEGDSRVPMNEMRKQVLHFCRLHWVRVLMWAYVFTAISCFIVLAAPLEDHHDAVYNSTARRSLRAGGVVTSAGVAATTLFSGGSLMHVPEMVYVGDEKDETGVLWLFLFAAIFLMMPYFVYKLFTPYEKLNIFMLSVVKMLQRDLMVFLLLFGFFMIDFYFALYVLYPRAGLVYMPQVTTFNTWYTALRSLFELAFTGSPSAINLDTDFTLLSTAQQVDFCIWLVVYLFFIILSLILLLNLLIAMLSFTFEAVRAESTLQCRTSFSQCLMRLELQAVALGINVNVGEKKPDGTYAYDFRSLKKLKSTLDGAYDISGADEGSNDPFAIPDGGPIARIETKVFALEAKIDQILANNVSAIS